MNTPERDLIILHGFPGAGKTTQSRRLCEENADIGHISIGEVWRGVMNGVIDSQYSEQVMSQDITKKQSDNLTNRLLFEALQRLDSSQQVILVDGYPRYETAIEPFFLMTEEKRCRILGGVCLELSIDDSVDRVEGRGVRVGEERFLVKGISSRDKYVSFYENTYLKTIPRLRTLIDMSTIDASRDVDEVYESTKSEIYRLLKRKI